MLNNKKNYIVAAALAVSAMLLAGCNTSDEREKTPYAYGQDESSIQTTDSFEASSVGTSSSTMSTVSVDTSFSAGESEPVEASSVENIPDKSESDGTFSYDENIVYIRSSSKENESHEPETNVTSADFSSVDAIKTVCGIKSEVEIDYTTCLVYTEPRLDYYGNTKQPHNPYDVEYDYGDAYDEYVDACDWSLVFDADFYMEKFPLLAIQYHDDKALLLEHFQTVGIHEGRQGNADFNVGAYMDNCGSDIKDAFGDDYEGYYFYYMLNYDSEKSVVTTASDSKLQQKTIMTAYQAKELEAVNAYRREVGSHDIEFDSELAAWSNFRGYINAHDGYRAHDWFKQDTYYTNIVYGIYDCGSFSENTATQTTSHPKAILVYESYRNSEGHYKAMIADKNDLIGVGNCFYGTGVVSQFDSFINL